MSVEKNVILESYAKSTLSSPEGDIVHQHTKICGIGIERVIQGVKTSKNPVKWTHSLKKISKDNEYEANTGLPGSFKDATGLYVVE